MRFLKGLYNLLLYIWEYIKDFVEDHTWTLISVACFVILIVMITTGNDSSNSCV